MSKKTESVSSGSKIWAAPDSDTRVFEVVKPQPAWPFPSTIGSTFKGYPWGDTYWYMDGCANTILDVTAINEALSKGWIKLIAPLRLVSAAQKATSSKV